VIGRRLNLPVFAECPEEVAEHFGFLAFLTGHTYPGSSAQPQEQPLVLKSSGGDMSKFTLRRTALLRALQVFVEPIYGATNRINLIFTLRESVALVRIVMCVYNLAIFS
jgi:hypothetical protein